MLHSDKDEEGTISQPHFPPTPTALPPGPQWQIASPPTAKAVWQLTKGFPGPLCGGIASIRSTLIEGKRGGVCISSHQARRMDKKKKPCMCNFSERSC